MSTASVDPTSLGQTMAAVVPLIEATAILWLCGYLVQRITRARTDRDLACTTAIGIPIGLGIFVRYFFELAAGSSLVADMLTLACAVAAVPGMILSARRARAAGNITAGSSPWRAGTSKIAILAVIWLPLAWLCVVYPVIIGDAKEIWFFHAKMIFYGKGINAGAGFQDAAVVFSHPDYPKLVATIGASIANFSGRWNDYQPKFSVALAWLPLFCFFADVMRSRYWPHALLMLFSIASGAGFLIFSGYMDGLLAGWCVGLAGAAWLMTQRQNDGTNWAPRHDTLASFAGLSLAMMLNLKIEGLPLVLLLSATTVWAHGPRSIPARRLFLSAMPGLVTYAMWRAQSARWGLLNDMTADPRASWDRLSARMGSSESWEIIHRAFDAHLVTPWIWIPSMLVIGIACARNPRDLALRNFASAFFAALAYAAFLVVVYLSTHHELGWHLTYSALRTLLPAQSLVMFACGMLVLENARVFRRK